MKIRDIDVLVPIERYDEVESTSRLARQAVESGELGDQARLFVASRQTAGVGRFGRRWESPAGGLWCTLAWPVNLSPRRVLDGLGLRIGMACVHTVEQTLGAHGHGEGVTLKWPNDVFVKGKKVLGVLTEVIERRGKTYALVGVGVNGNFPVADLPAELQDAATTLMDIVHGRVNLDRVLEGLRMRLCEALMTEGVSPQLLIDLRSHLHGVGRQVTITLPDKTKKTGELLGVGDDGRLRLRIGDEEYAAPSSAELHHEQP